MLKPTPKTRVLFVRRLTPVMLVVFGVFYVALSVINSPKTAYAATSNTINFQARLQTKAGAIVPDGNYNVEFKLYNAKTSSGSSEGSCTNDSHCLWVEKYTKTSGPGSTDVRVQVVNGYLSVQLGSVNAFGAGIDWTQNLWLTMNIGGTSDTASWDGEMDPRLPLTAVPYAFAAGQLQTTNGNGTSTLSIQGSSSGNQTFQIQDQGAGGTYNILVAPSGSGPALLQNGNSLATAVNIGAADNNALNLITNGTTRAAIAADGSTLTLGNNMGLELQGASGYISNAQGTANSEAFGAGATVAGNSRATAIGNGANGAANDSVAVGYNSSSQDSSVAVGSGATCGNNACVAIGYNTSSGFGDVVVGEGASITGNESVAIGSGANALFKGVAIGTGATVANDNSIAIGHGATTTGENQLVIGGSTADGAPISNVYIGSGVADLTPQDVTLQATSATAVSTTDTAGASITIAGGQGTGTGNGGNINFQIAKPGTTGSSQNALATVASISGANGSALFKNAANSTAAFQVQNTSSASLFTVDTTNSGKITFGASAGSGTVITNNGVLVNTTLPLGDFSGGGSIGSAATTVDLYTSISIAQTTSGKTLTLPTPTATTAYGRMLYISNIGTTPFTLLGTPLNNGVTATLIWANTNGGASWQYAGADGSSILNQSASTQTADFNISGNGTLGGTLTAPTLQSAASTALTVTGNAASTWSTSSGLLTIQGAGGVSVASANGVTSSAVTIQSGNASAGASGNVTIDTGTSTSGTPTINIATANAKAVTIGNTTTNIATTINGTVLVKPTSTHDSTTAFLVQNAAATTNVFDVDTQNARVGIGTNAPGRTLDVSVNTSTTDSMQVRVSQAGSGDAGVEFQAAGKTFVNGIDATDGKFKIASTITNGGSTTFGNTGTGGTTDSGNNGVYECSKFTATATGTVSTLTVIYKNIDTTNKSAQAALYTNNSAAAPGTRLGSSSTVTLSANGSYNFTLSSSVNVTDGTAYWICAASNSTLSAKNNLVYDSGATNQIASITSGFSFGTWPSTMGSVASYFNGQYEMYATVTAGSDQFAASLFSLSDSGQVTFQNTADSTNAFQVQNSSGNSLFNIDSSNDNISMFSGTTASLGTTWTSTSAINGASPQARFGATTVTANGYIYVMGGTSDNNTLGAYSANTYYAKINADGSISSSWTAGTSLPTVSYKGMAFTANGYVYYLGGWDGNNAHLETYYAKLNADGSMGSWVQTTSMSSKRSSAAAVYLNGYVYVTGGYNDSTYVGSTIYAKVNANGTIGSWNTAAALPASAVIARETMVAANGYIYLMGGTTTNNDLSQGQTTVYYAKPSSSTGNISSWSTSVNALPAAAGLSGATAVVSNGYVYYIGGIDTSSTPRKAIYYAQLPAAGGDLGSWSTSSSRLPDGLWDANSVVVNGYVYEIGGNDSSATTTSVSTIYYTSFNRVQIAGSLDLVGSQGATLADGGSDQSTGSTGGSITAGNGIFIGSLQVQGQGTFNQSLAVNGAFAVDSMFSVDITQERVTIGPAAGDTTGALLVLGNKTSAGDPGTEVDGAMYYNSSMGSFRCGVSGTWQACVGGLLKSNTSVQSGDTISNTTSETNFATNYSLPANYCVPGRVIRVTAAGVWNATGSPNLSVKIKLGSTVIAQHLNDGLTTVTNMPWRLDFQFICDAAPSASSAIEAQGQINLWDQVASANFWSLYNTSTVNVATNAAQTLQMSMQFSAASSSNNITMRQFIVEGLGP